MIKNTIFILVFIFPILGQEIDSLSNKTPKNAAKKAMMFPGGGQFYNGQPIKGSLILGLAIASAYMSSNNAKKYQNYTGTNSSVKQGYLKQRNKYGWRIIYIYIYGLLDAIVEAHLHPFEDVMNEDLEQPKQEENKE